MLLLYAKNVADMAEIHQALPSQFYLLKPLLGQYFKEYFTADTCSHRIMLMPIL